MDERGVYSSGATIRQVGHEILTMKHEHLVTIGGHIDYQSKVLVEGIDCGCSKGIPLTIDPVQK